ncbi:hypothetical protein D9M73_78800 [compost metagenome]|jgi:hypothetical protein
MGMCRSVSVASLLTSARQFATLSNHRIENHQKIAGGSNDYLVRMSYENIPHQVGP